MEWLSDTSWSQVGEPEYVCTCPSISDPKVRCTSIPALCFLPRGL